MKENGNKVLKKDKAFGKVSLVIHTLGNGLKVKLMVMGSINGKTEIDMKENGNFV